MRKAVAGVHFGGLTATAATVITAFIPPRVGFFSLLTRILYRCAGTAHTISIQKSLNVTTLTSAAAASQAVINLAVDPGTGTVAGAIANTDYVLVQLDDGTFFLQKVASVASLAITLTTNLPATAAAGNKVWFFGAPGDQPASSQTTQKRNPLLGYQILATVSVMNDWGDNASGICQSNNPNEPIMISSNNATAAGFFELVAGSHVL